MPKPDEANSSENHKMRLEYFDPKTLQPHPLNWRKHGIAQRTSFSGLLDEVGMVDAVIYNERTNRLLDGHMRVQEFLERNAEEIPVLVVDLPEDKEHLVLYFKDRIGDMADSDRSLELQLGELLQTDDEALQAMLAGLDSDMEETDMTTSGGAVDSYNVGLNPGEQFNYVVLVFRSELSWTRAQNHFELQREHDVLQYKKLAIGRIVDGDKYLYKRGFDGY
jgi:hypothetical protein